ncbi:MAG TPA: HhH-GPD-type base excision DNA repair protein [Gaiellaceae bacterium]|nr:HhH-GPD-type base excision DNA repair protein [Gaiellaceae bacterium]
MAATTVDALYFTGDPAADAFLGREPLALLIGFALDQQVTVQKAFSAPLELSKRIGGFDAGRIAGMEPAVLEEAFRAKPALHRYPGVMAKRIQELARVIESEYGGHAERVWTEAADGADLRRRLEGLPGFGDMKVRSITAVLAKRFGDENAQDIAPDHPTLGDVDSPEALEEYQAKKRAYKAAQRAGQKASWDSPR